MSPRSHKGSSGRVGVLGGSELYTGAPYYAAMASLKVGCDLASVFCAEEAAIPIKCYSPELMVQGVYSAGEFDAHTLDDADEIIGSMVCKVASHLNRLHVLVVGPGLGRCPLVMRATARIITLARAQELPIVVDADALFMLSLEEYRDILAGYEYAILTPNVMEMRRLTGDHASHGDADDIVPNISAMERNILIRKGLKDAIISMGENEVQTSTGLTTKMLCEEKGGLKRSGGIGDVLAGTVGAFVAWNRIMCKQNSASHERTSIESSTKDDLLLACWSACCVTKRATLTAFEKKSRSMTAPDVLEELGPTLENMITP